MMGIFDNQETLDDGDKQMPTDDEERWVVCPQVNRCYWNDLHHTYCDDDASG